jgi:hypothetical protein
MAAPRVAARAVYRPVSRRAENDGSLPVVGEGRADFGDIEVGAPLAAEVLAGDEGEGVGPGFAGEDVLIVLYGGIEIEAAGHALGDGDGFQVRDGVFVVDGEHGDAVRMEHAAHFHEPLVHQKFEVGKNGNAVDEFEGAVRKR